MARPLVEGGGAVFVLCDAIVDAGDAALMPAQVGERGLDDMRQDADLGHVSCNAAPNVMNAPRLVKVQLGVPEQFLQYA